MLNLNGSMYKAGVPFSTIWSLDFTDDFFRRGLRQWLASGTRGARCRAMSARSTSRPFRRGGGVGRRLAADLRRRKAIMGIFDEGCMGMYNAIADNELLNPLGVL